MPLRPKAYGRRAAAARYEDETVRRLRPFRRRRDRTLRPPGVLIRARNPWVLARFLFRG